MNDTRYTTRGPKPLPRKFWMQLKISKIDMQPQPMLSKIWMHLNILKIENGSTDATLEAPRATSSVASADSGCGQEVCQGRAASQALVVPRSLPPLLMLLLLLFLRADSACFFLPVWVSPLLLLPMASFVLLTSWLLPLLLLRSASFLPLLLRPVQAQLLPQTKSATSSTCRNDSYLNQFAWRHYFCARLQPNTHIRKCERKLSKPWFGKGWTSVRYSCRPVCARSFVIIILQRQ